MYADRIYAIKIREFSERPDVPYMVELLEWEDSLEKTLDKALVNYT
jgi:hypothetical protein